MARWAKSQTVRPKRQDESRHTRQNQTKEKGRRTTRQHNTTQENTAHDKDNTNTTHHKAKQDRTMQDQTGRVNTRQDKKYRRRPLDKARDKRDESQS